MHPLHPHLHLIADHRALLAFDRTAAYFREQIEKLRQPGCGKALTAAVAEVVPLATMQHRWLPAPMPWANARVLVKANFTWGTCLYIDAATGRLVVEHSFNGERVFRTYRHDELRHPTDRGPGGAA